MWLGITHSSKRSSDRTEATSSSGSHLLRQRRRGDVQTLRGAPEMELLGDGHEVAQLAQFHAAARGYAAY